MKKIITFILLGMFLSGIILPVSVGAEEFQAMDGCTIWKDFNVPPAFDVAGDNVNEDDVINADQSDSWGIICLVNTVYKVTDIIFFIIFSISVVFIAIGAFFYLVSYGDPSRTEKGRNYIVYSMIGIVIAAFSRIIPAIVKYIVF